MSEQPYYSIEFRHSEKSFMALAHMQYDLFCQRNRIVRSIISIALILAGVKLSGQSVAFYLLTAYGCYLLTSTYSSANHTARNLINAVKASGKDYPKSRYNFEKDGMHVIGLPDEEELSVLRYHDIRALGEDADYLYIFRDEHGGYMISAKTKKVNIAEFKAFLEAKSGQRFVRQRTPLNSLLEQLRKKENEPYHL